MTSRIVETIEDLGFYWIKEENGKFYFEKVDRSRLNEFDLDAVEVELGEFIDRYDYEVYIDGGNHSVFIVDTFF
tara:strand:- start:289 stop:510 length:222 start_codon:yes stop_codon:yes gene_type:complete